MEPLRPAHIRDSATALSLRLASDLLSFGSEAKMKLAWGVQETGKNCRGVCGGARRWWGVGAPGNLGPEAECSGFDIDH